MSMTVSALFRHPVKGLSPEPLDAIVLEPGRPVPGDRRFALLGGSAPFDTLKPEWLPKSAFLTLATRPRLGELTTRWIGVANTLTVERKGRQVARGDLTSAIGRAMLEEFFGAFLKEGGATPRIVEAQDFAFTDTRQPLIHIITAASLRDLERVAGQPMDPRRFRANVVIDGGTAWMEDGWIGQTLTMGGTRLEVIEATTRCAAPNVNPDTGQTDLSLGRLLAGGLGRTSFGVYARVIEGGAVAVGDVVEPPTG